MSVAPGATSLVDHQKPARSLVFDGFIGFWIEELRVQIWDQRLGTARAVNPKRIRVMVG
ncbi:hypothetical protein [Propionimicrobium sp. PCR01-08-3]|uniref:hypothetical protein n=1 Tax=Propionimicrobium sp. PCR01-08-3 TaxID=3052086 RepID=UPI00255C5AAC|nr:hypothetical protein [Propionimicrobium sp. PCR01-08-3]WIY81599.1 hypothetical protein QQ658_08625 [Propionimicrobium sp. PCR01-08-3]